MARVLITGATGFIGKHLMRSLQTEHEVFALTRRELPPGISDRVHWLKQDLTQALDHSCLPKRVDAIIHLAQSKFYRQFPDRAEDIFAVNIYSTFQLLEYARQAGVECFIFASSGGVYGYSYEKFVETDPVSPLNFYLSSKYTAELLIANYQPFFRTVVIRFFFVYGPGQRKSMLIPRLVESVVEGRPITLQGKNGIRVNPTYVSDAVAAICRSLALSGHHKINVAGPEVLSLREIGEVIGKVVGKEPRFECQSGSNPQHIIGDIRKMTEMLGPPTVRFEEGIRSYLEGTKR